MRRACCPLHATALRYPDAQAVVAPSEEALAFAECDAQAAAVASALRSKGLKGSDRIALLGPFAENAVPVLFGAFREGIAVYIPNARLPEGVLRENIARMGCRYVAGGETAGDLPPRLAPEELVAHACQQAAAEVCLDAPATIIATSGSSAEPKMAVHSLENHVANAAASNQNIAVAPGDRWLLSLPLYHVSGVGTVFRCVLGGAAIAVPGPGEPLEESIARLKVTHVSLVAAQLRRLLETGRGRAALVMLKAALLGGSAIPAGLVERAAACGVPLHTTYGLTETASQAATTPHGAGLAALKTSGLPLTPDTVRIAQDGEIQVRGRTLFLGYVREDGTLSRPVTPDGWFPTGDLGRFDDAGNLVVTGRKDNMFISGGENIQPEEIEAVLCALDEVARAFVVPVADAEFGYRPLAFIEPASGCDVDPELLSRCLGATLPRYKLPVAYRLLPGEALEVGIKPSRRFLQELAQDTVRATSDAPSRGSDI